MEGTILFILFCTALEEGIGKHIFVPLNKTWHDAQAYCKRNHVDLSFVSSQEDQNKLQTAAGKIIVAGWIGLHKEDIRSSAWKWSGGGNVTYQNWGLLQPNNHAGKENAAELLSDGKWNDLNSFKLRPFYCTSFTLVKVQETWEDALEHCREADTDLPTLNSETEWLLTLSKIQQSQIEGVWIGLRYLGDHWLWMNGDPLGSKPWLQGGAQDYQCPKRGRCGALTIKGHWENRDCEKKLYFICP